MKVALAAGFALLSLSATAHAHFSILMPPPASTTTDGGKGAPPCGPVPDSGIITPAQGGHALTLQVAEMVFHPGFYRVALALNSTDELPADNIVLDKMGNVLAPDSNGLSDAARYEVAPVLPVLADGLWQHDMEHEAPFQTELTLPNVTCEKCTLQVIEFMSNHEASFFYHHCANLKITADPALPAFDPTANSGGAPALGSSNGSSPVGGADGSGGSGGSASGGGGVGGTDPSAASGNGGAGGSGNLTAGASGTSPFGAAPTAGTGAAGSAGVVAPTSSSATDSSCALPHRPVSSPAGLAGFGLVLLGALRRRPHRAHARRRARPTFRRLRFRPRGRGRDAG